MDLEFFYIFLTYSNNKSNRLCRFSDDRSGMDVSKQDLIFVKSTVRRIKMKRDATNNLNLLLKKYFLSFRLRARNVWVQTRCLKRDKSTLWGLLLMWLSGGTLLSN